MKSDGDNSKELVGENLTLDHNIDVSVNLTKERRFDLDFNKLSQRTGQMLDDEDGKIGEVEKTSKLIERNGEEIAPGIKIQTSGWRIIFEQDLDKCKLFDNQRFALRYFDKNKKISKICYFTKDGIVSLFDNNCGNIYELKLPIDGLNMANEKYFARLRLVLQEKIDNKNEYKDLSFDDFDVLIKFFDFQRNGIDVFADQTDKIASEKDIPKEINENLNQVTGFCLELNNLIDKNGYDNNYKIKQLMLDDGGRDDRVLDYYNFQAFPEQGKIYGNINCLEKEYSLSIIYHEAAHIFYESIPEDRADGICKQKIKNDFYELLDVCGLDKTKLDFKTEYRQAFEKNELFRIIDESRYVKTNLSEKDKNKPGHPYDGFEEMFASIIAITQIPQYREQMINNLKLSSLDDKQKTALSKAINDCLKTMNKSGIEVEWREENSYKPLETL
ncbi:MAG: hypothetical protein ACOZAR_03495 [Patescibacteria group bacterium]